MDILEREVHLLSRLVRLAWHQQSWAMRVVRCQWLQLLSRPNRQKLSNIGHPLLSLSAVVDKSRH